MKKIFFSICLLCLSVLLSSCGSSRPSEFYILKANPSLSRTYSHQVCTNIALGPVKLEKYLDRSQMVVFGKGNKVDISEFHRWAEPLKDNIESVLSANLRNGIPACEVFDYPWSGAAQYKYQVKVKITRFDVSKTGLSTLVAHWSVLSKEGNTLVNKTSRFLVRLKKAGCCNYQDKAAAMNKNLSRLSAVIVSSIRRL